MTPEVVPLRARTSATERLRRLHGVYAAGTAVWTVSLLAAVLGHDADVRQVLVLLALLASFALMWLWSARMLCAAACRAGRRGPR
ncbi:hypothetical protein [Streptomyces kebangsaanensis]|uniref:Uncharacterized protein n=1 Tax=Streptomyces kebangsaanensis TaxID=864058 RepID=A0ABW6KY17_9ACTN|nr:hypothetical protein [Streptomyces kebangsaanensis]